MEFAAEAARYELNRAHIESFARQMKRKKPTAPQPPRGCETLWAWFCDLNIARGATGFGPAPLTHEALWFWSDLTGIRPSPDECRLLIIIDRAYLSAKQKD